MSKWANDMHPFKFGSTTFIYSNYWLQRTCYTDSVSLLLPRFVLSWQYWMVVHSRLVHKLISYYNTVTYTATRLNEWGCYCLKSWRSFHKNSATKAKREQPYPKRRMTNGPLKCFKLNFGLLIGRILMFRQLTGFGMILFSHASISPVSHIVMILRKKLNFISTTRPTYLWKVRQPFVNKLDVIVIFRYHERGRRECKSFFSGRVVTNSCSL